MTLYTSSMTEIAAVYPLHDLDRLRRCRDLHCVLATARALNLVSKSLLEPRNSVISTEWRYRRLSQAARHHTATHHLRCVYGVVRPKLNFM